MRRAFSLFLACLLYPLGALFADVDDEVLGSETITETAKESPLSLRARYDYVFNSRFEKQNIDKEHLKFGEGSVDLTGVFLYREQYCEGAYLIAGYINTLLDWKQNPFFSNTNFNRLNLNLGVFSKRFPRWFWTAQAGINLDTDRMDLWQYATYDIVLWGRYTYTDSVHLHTGMLIQTGMKMDRFYPIVGFDWTFWRCVTLHAVYPVNIALSYQITQRWSTSVAARFFNSRSRAGAKEPLPMAVWRYQNSGIEGNITYDIPSWGFHLNVHGGWAFGGDLRIANRHNHHPRHFKFRGAPYVGGEIIFKY